MKTIQFRIWSIHIVPFDGRCHVNVAVDVIENEWKTTQRHKTNIIKANCWRDASKNLDTNSNMVKKQMRFFRSFGVSNYICLNAWQILVCRIYMKWLIFAYNFNFASLEMLNGKCVCCSCGMHQGSFSQYYYTHLPHSERRTKNITEWHKWVAHHVLLLLVTCFNIWCASSIC